MAQVKTLYYVDKVFYHYFIGREDQSVQEGVMIRRIDQQLRVNRLMLAQVDLDQVENKRLRRYLLNYLEIITTISTVLLFRAGDKEHLEKARAFWRDMARDYPRHYQLLSRRLFGRVLNMPGPGGRWIALAWLPTGSARRFLALTESGEKIRACPVGTGPVFRAFFPAAGENPVLRLAFGREEFYNKNAQCLGCQSAPLAARSARAHQGASARARGLHPRQVAPRDGG